MDKILDPATQKGSERGNVRYSLHGKYYSRASRLSPTALSVAKIYQQYYAPTISTRIYNNFPTMLAGTS